jgi:outer membrane protein
VRPAHRALAVALALIPLCAQAQPAARAPRVVASQPVIVQAPAEPLPEAAGHSAAPNLVQSQTPAPPTAAPAPPRADALPPSSAQPPGPLLPPLALADAQQLALANRPALRARALGAQAAGQAAAQAESARWPQVYGNLTAATAYQEETLQNGREVKLDTRIAAGGLNNPTVFRRDAAGIAVSQLITDFGRTSSLVRSARLNETAQQQQVNATRAQVLLEVTDGYYAVLQSQAVLRVAQKTVEARAAMQARIAALARSRMKSELDVRFAEVNLGEARLLLSRAQNAVDAGFARLSAALGYRETRRFQLQDQSPDQAPLDALAALTRAALAARPELASLRAEQQSAEQYAQAQKALRYPTVNAYAAGGVVPSGDPRFPDNYGAIGVNVNLALFDGGKITALQREAQLRARAAAENLSEAENSVVQGVQVAWLNARAAWENIAITQALLEAAQQALRLAESRYNLGLTAIVELNQAQLSAVDAEIAWSRAKYDYLSARNALAFQVGGLDARAR